MRSPRLAVLATLVVVVAGLGWVGRGSDETAPSAGSSAARSFAMPTADDPDALSSTWYCAAGEIGAGGGAAADEPTVIIANALDQARRGTVTWFTGDGEPVVEPVQVNANDVVALDAADSLDEGAASAVVELEGGGVAVERRITAPEGADTAPCSSGPSGAWHFANGATARDGRQHLYLFNPFPDDVIVDITLATDDLREQPGALQGVPIAPGTTTVVDLGEHVRRREVTATTVAARNGRLVVDRVQAFDGSEGRSGLTVTAGAPTVAPEWHFPDGRHGDERAQRWHLYNPGEEEAIVLIEVVPADGDVPEPIERTVPAGAQVVVEAAELPGVPADTWYHSTVRTINDVEVVAELELDSRTDGLRGWSSTLGAPVSARRWLLPGGQAEEGTSRTLVVSNPSARTVRMNAVLLAGGNVVDVPEGRGVELRPAQRVALSLDAVDRAAIPILVEASGDVVVERRVVGSGGEGVSIAVGIPMR